MFDRGPNGYLFEYTVIDDIFLMMIGLAGVIYGIHLISFRQDKFDYMGPIIGLFCFIPGGIMFFGTILYLLGFLV